MKHMIAVYEVHNPVNNQQFNDSKERAVLSMIGIMTNNIDFSVSCSVIGHKAHQAILSNNCAATITRHSQSVSRKSLLSLHDGCKIVQCEQNECIFQAYVKLQIKRGNRDNLKITGYISP